ncbi:ABC transporter ATP-binding protein [Paenibacillus pasadenensis]|uniref:ABC transporter ATP-binding protein n=1 Tax=Paenibacillus pasadenensis TaxID=217090 RepID=A0A2N5MZS3_9BACL|nr:ABC transporter ATP-binding protein [Paenibacillus pasadenensis]PLT43580.1 ABC transporter ATP-binding protein [Paenibacillus pasadenensis]
MMTVKDRTQAAYALEADRLTKSYGAQKALDGVSLKLEAGLIHGLLGRNGAGKTTLMSIATAQLFATSGEVRIFGQQPYENREALSKICFIKESQRYPDMFHVEDVLATARALYPNWDEALAGELVESFRLPRRKKIKGFSRGMLSSVGIVVGLSSRAELTLFDEPYLGLDAVARSLFYDRLIEDYAEHPRTVVLSTHLIDEVSRLLEAIHVIDGGRLLLSEDAESLRSRAYRVSGSAAKVDAVTAGRRVLRRETIGGSAVASVLAGEPGENGIGRAREAGLEAEPLPLQQLIVDLTAHAARGKEESA